MRRAEALRALSRDHHVALVVARLLRRAGADDAEEARRRFLAFWEEHGRGPFRAEEEVLLPTYVLRGAEPDLDLVQRILLDHLLIRAAAARLAGPAAGHQELNALGARLDEHVRIEERRLFPLIERALDDAELASLARALEADGDAG